MCWRITPKAGSINNLKLCEENLPDPSFNQVQIKVEAIGLNFADIFAMYGLYSATPEGSFVPGLEFAGTVSKIGGDVTDFSVGDKIMGVTKFGAYASHLNIEKEYITALPDEWNFGEGAALLVQMLTAYWALIELANIKKNDTVLIHSAAGGVGIWANRIAKCFDAYTIGTIGTTSKAELLKNEGYDDFIVRSENFKSDLKRKLGDRELNIVLESIGGKIFVDSYSTMAKTGRMVVYGSARYAQKGARPNYLKLIWQFLKRPKLDPQKMIEQNKAVLGFNLIHLYDKKEKFREILEDVKRYEIGKPVIGHSFEFKDIKKAIRLFQTGKTTGKVVVYI